MKEEKKNTEIAKRTYHSSKNVNQHNVREAAANQTENKANKKPTSTAHTKIERLFMVV